MIFFNRNIHHDTNNIRNTKNRFYTNLVNLLINIRIYNPFLKLKFIKLNSFRFVWFFSLKAIFIHRLQPP